MDIIPSASITPPSTTVAASATTTNLQNHPKSPDPETETPTRILPVKPVTFTNGVLKRHQPPPHLQLHHPVVVHYKECLKNHAASIGGHALDGCGEFMPSPSATATDPTSFKCAACGCHRNFHRREHDEVPPSVPAIEYQPHHRHQPPPPPSHRSPSSASPPPISSSYMLLALSGHQNPTPTTTHTTTNTNTNLSPLDPNLHLSGHHHNSGSRKRFRTKFTQYQKERMLEFAGRIGWKIQKRDEETIRNFCKEINVDRGVLKVWMHNNKNTFGKRSDQHQLHHLNGNGGNFSSVGGGGLSVIGRGNSVVDDTHNSDERSENLDRNDGSSEERNLNNHRFEINSLPRMGANGSSSSS